MPERRSVSSKHKKPYPAAAAAKRKEIPRKRIRLNRTHTHTHARTKLRNKKKIYRSELTRRFRVHDRNTAVLASFTAVRLSGKYPADRPPLQSDAGRRRRPVIYPVHEIRLISSRQTSADVKSLSGRHISLPGPRTFYTFKPFVHGVRASTYSAAMHAAVFVATVGLLVSRRRLSVRSTVRYNVIYINVCMYINLFYTER